MIDTFTEKQISQVIDSDYNTILCIGEKSTYFKKQLTDHQYLCVHFMDIEQASQLLGDALTEYGFLPHAIIVDADLEGHELNGFLTLIKKSALLRDIPLFLFVNHLDKSDFEKYNRISLIDDIYSKASHVNELIGRIEFLKKYKKEIKKLNDINPVVKVDNENQFDLNPIFKRAGDMVIAAVLIVMLAPLFILIGLVISLESRGPVFYSSLRAGKGFKVFKFYKFRTMFQNSDSMIKKLAHLNQYNNTEKANFFKISNDPRITKVGGFLRNTSLDELPQLFNVLKGDMSIVGNRPLPLYEANSITTDDYSRRFLAPAGLTGLWQVSKRGNKNMSTEERLDLDITYSEQWCFMSDFNIIMRTPKALIQKDNV